MVRWPSSLVTRLLALQTAGFALIAVLALFLLFFDIREQVHRRVRLSGIAAAELLASVIGQSPELIDLEAGREGRALDAALEDFIFDVPNVERMTVVDARLRVVAYSGDGADDPPLQEPSVAAVISRPGQEILPRIVEEDGRRVMRIVRPIEGQGNEAGAGAVIGAVVIDLSMSEAADRIRIRFIRTVSALGLLVAAQIALQYVVLRRSAVDPLRRLVQAARRIGGGNYLDRVPVDSTLELGDLGRAFNQMVEEVERTSAGLRANAEALERIIEASPLAIIQLDDDLRVTLWNPSAERIFGWSEREALGSRLRTVPPELEEEGQGIIDAMRRGESVTGLPTQRTRKDGTVIDVVLSASPLHDGEGRIMGFSALVADNSLVKRAEADMKASHSAMEASLAKLQQRTQELVLLSELSDLLQSCARPEEGYQLAVRSLRKMFPARAGAIFEISPSRDLVEPVATWGEDGGQFASFVQEDCWALRRGQIHRVEAGDAGLVCAHARAGGLGALPSICAPLAAQGEALGVLHLIDRTGAGGFDAEELNLIEAVAKQVGLAISNLRLREALRQQSIRDALTGLFNRRYMDETLAREVRRGAREKKPVSVIMLDIDHFKMFNDTFGHEAGDAVLRTLGHFLASTVRGEDIACRYGGEEFAIVLPGASLEAAAHRAEQLRLGAQGLKVDYHGRALGQITLSLGVAVFPQHGSRGDMVVAAADAALYRAKEGGRDQVALAPLPS